MKKKLFDIESDEVKRILSLHEERTKSQYLTIISEEIPNIKYNAVPTLNTKTPKQQPVGKESYTIGKDFSYYDLENTAFNKDELRLMTGTKFVKSTKNPSMLITQSVRVDFPQNLTGTVEKSDTSTANVYYNCKYGKFGITNVKGNTSNNKFNWYDEEKRLTSQLKQVCQYNAPKQEPVKKDQPKQETKQVTQVSGNKTTQAQQQQFATQTTQLNTQIQTSLGTQKPTGQLTDADIDAILAKLG